MTTKPTRLPTALLCAAALVALATGCTSSAGSGADHTPPTATVQQPTSGPAPSATASPSATIPDLPPAEPGTATLAAVALRSAGTNVAALSVKAGDLAVTIMCTGGPLVLHMEPVSTTTIPCATNGVTPTRNNFHLGSPKDINVSVDAPTTVQWNMRIEQ